MTFPVVVPADLDRVCKRLVEMPEPGYFVKEDDGPLPISNASVKLDECLRPVLRDGLRTAALGGELVVEGREFRLVRVAVVRTKTFETNEPGFLGNGPSPDRPPQICEQDEAK